MPPPISSGERLIPGIVEEFSTPGVVETPCRGLAFPWSVEMLSARLFGLLGDVRARRITGREILALGGYGMANGDCWEELGNNTKLPCADLREGDSEDGEYEVFLDGE